jgi:hypothetical protein
LAAHRAAYGLPPDPELAMLNRYLTLRPFPASFQDPARPVAPTTHYLRPMLGDRSGEEGLPAWVSTLRDRRVVYVGLGTVFNEPKIFRVFLAGLRDEALTLIVTVGRNQDPSDFGPQPANIHIERYIPLSLLLPHCDLAVTNGGSGTLIAALAHGLPVVVVPMAAGPTGEWGALRGVGAGPGGNTRRTDTRERPSGRADSARRSCLPRRRRANGRDDSRVARAGVRGSAAGATRGGAPANHEWWAIACSYCGVAPASSSNDRPWRTRWPRGAVVDCFEAQPYHLLTAAVFGHGLAALCDDGLAGVNGHAVDGGDEGAPSTAGWTRCWAALSRA